MFLSGRTALVTGSSRNLGAVIAERLAAHGASVAVTYHGSERPARELVERLGGGPHLAVGGDLADAAQVRSLVAAAADGLGGGTGRLVHKARAVPVAPLPELA